MDNILFIINPAAGGGKTIGLIPIIEERMKKANREFKIQLTGQPNEATKFAEEMVDMYPIIVAVGGDGTINEVAKGLINKKKGVLGIIPSGTGNDFVRAIGMEIDPIKSLDAIIKGKTKKIDVGKINNYSFLNIASFGFDTEVVIFTNNIKKKVKSRIAYIIGILSTLLSYKKKKTKIIIDDEVLERNLVLLAVGNGNYYGGGLYVLPMAEINDGYFHICLVRNINNFKILFLFPSIIKGNHLKYENYIEIFKAKKVKIINNEDVSINIDGEIVHVDKDIVFEMDKYKLNTIIP